MGRILLLGLVFIGMVFTACVSNSSERVTQRIPQKVALSGVVVDGLLENATVCLDKNANNQCDTGEPIATSNGGNFTLEVDDRTSGEYKIISIGGIDTATNQPFDGMLENMVNIQIAKEIPFSTITPLTTLASKIYKEQKIKDNTYTLLKAQEVLAADLNLTVQQIQTNPLTDISLFGKTQELIQMAKLFTIDIEGNETTSELRQKRFDKVFTQIASTISSETNSTDINVSKIAQNINIDDPSVVIADNIVKFIKDYTVEVNDKISSVSTIEELIPMQKVIDSFTYQVSSVKNDPTNIDITNSLADILTNFKATSKDQIVANAESIVLDNMTTQKPTIYLDPNSDNGISNTDNITSETTLTIKGTAEVGANIFIKDDTNSTIATTVADESGNYTTTLNLLSNGVYNLKAIAKDKVSNINTSDILVITIDTASFLDLNTSSDSGSFDTDNITNDNTPVILTDKSTTIIIKDVNLTLMQTVVSILDGTSFVAKLSTLDDGVYTIVTDTNSSIGSSLEITIDTTAPVFNSYAFDMNGTVIDKNVTITKENPIVPGTKASDANVISYNLSGDDSSYFNINTSTGEVSLIDSSNINSVLKFSVDAVDVAGNSSSLNFNVVVKSIATFNTDKFTPTKTKPSQLFGESIAISGDYIVVGASGKSDNNEVAGRVYLYKKDINNRVYQISKLLPSDGVVGDEFGSSVSIFGKYIIVGAKKEATKGFSAGAAYLFKIDSDNNVSEVAKITASDTNAYDLFGTSVSISGDYVVIGAKWKDKEGINKTGAAYLFKINSDNNISELSKITASDIKLSDEFGSSVSIDNNYIVIGANGEDSGGDNAGAAYLFKISSDGNVSQKAKILALDPLAGDNFGASVSINGNYIIVGANGVDEVANETGAAYVFKKGLDDNVSQVVKLLDPDAIDGDNFGSSVSIFNNKIIVSSPKDTNSTGAVYLYNIGIADSVSEITKLSATDTAPNKLFGSSIAISESYIVVGATTDGLKAGSAYLYDIYADKPYMPTLKSRVDLYETGLLNQYDLSTLTNSLGATFTISGDDASLFVVQNNILKVIDKLDYENPIDLDADNNYSITIDITDSEAKTNSYDTTIAINNTTYLNRAKLLASDAEVGDKFGAAISVSGDYIVVGAPNENQVGDLAGAVYIYKKEMDNSVTELKKLIATDTQAGDNFGASVSIDGDYIAVGVTQQSKTNSNFGAVYIFKKQSDNNISQIAKLVASDGLAGDNFGKSVSVSGDYIVVGANLESTNNIGAAYIFKRITDNNITQVAKLLPLDGSAGDNFATSVSISGDYIVVGSNLEGINNTGAAYMFKRIADNNISQIAKLVASDSLADDNFATSVSISGDYIVVGADKEDSGGSDAGCSYIFKRYSDNNVSQIAKLVASDALADDNFGNSVDISNKKIIIGAKGKDEFGYMAGEAYLYNINSDTNITQDSKIVGTDIAKYSSFATSVSISGTNIVIGADEYKGDKSGSAYLFTPDEN